MVIDILPPVRASKGTAVQQFGRMHGLRGIVYLGDDSTDIKAFRELRALRASGTCDSLLMAVGSTEVPDDLIAEADGIVDGSDGAIEFLGMVASALEKDAHLG